MKISPRISWSRLCISGAVCALVALAAPFGASASPYTVQRVAEVPVDALAAADDGGQSAAEVSQKGREFVPAAVTIRVHRRVTIRNDDDVVHHAFCQAPEFKYNSGPLQPGTVCNLTFRSPGVYEIRCAIHPAMLLKVTVTE